MEGGEWGATERVTIYGASARVVLLGGPRLLFDNSSSQNTRSHQVATQASGGEFMKKACRQGNGLKE